MAAAENEKIERLRDRMLQCPICMDEYKDPRMLPCHHTVCLNCLLDYVHASSSSGRLFRMWLSGHLNVCTSRTFLLVGNVMHIFTKAAEDIKKCPQCRADVCVPRGGVKDFPPNFYINCIQDEIGSKPYFGICDVCERDWLVSQYRCIDCDLDICKFCIHDHRLFSHMTGRQSNIIRIETGNIGAHQTSDRFCSSHKDEHLQMFCLTCDLLVCVNCVCDTHKKHDTITLAKKLQLARKLLQSELDKNQDEVKRVKRALTKLHNVEKEGDKTADHALDKIQEHLQNVVSRLQKIAADKSEQINAVRGKYIKEIRDYETELAGYLDQLQRGSNFLSELQEEDMCLELVKCFEKYKGILEATEKTVINKTICQNVFSYLPGRVVERLGIVGIGRGNLQTTETSSLFMKKTPEQTKLRKFLYYSSQLFCVIFCIFVVLCLIAGFYQFCIFFFEKGFSTESIISAGFYTYLCLAGLFAFRKSWSYSESKEDNDDQR